MTAADCVVTEQELLATVEAHCVSRCYLLSGQQFNKTELSDGQYTKHIFADTAPTVTASSPLEQKTCSISTSIGCTGQAAIMLLIY